MKSTCGCGTKCANPHLGLLLLRIVTGLIFIHEGWTKFSGLGGTERFFQMLHLWPWLAPVVATVEFFGGIALLLGVWTCVFAPLLIIDMLGVLIFASQWTKGVFAAQFVVLLLAALVVIKTSGCGKWRVGGGCGCPVCTPEEDRV